jgi:hypothetical protein
MEKGCSAAAWVSVSRLSFRVVDGKTRQARTARRLVRGRCEQGET